MPLDPPVMTATLPSSFPMTFPLRLRLWSFGEVPENVEMGLPASGVQCRSAHIGGAKSIRLDRFPPFRIGPRLSAWAMMTAALPTYEMLFDVSDTGSGRRTWAVRDCTMI